MYRCKLQRRINKNSDLNKAKYQHKKAMFHWCFFLLIPLAAIVLFYMFIELHYFTRMMLCVFLARLVKKRCHILETTIVQGVCFTTDIDTLITHMNNARYFREIDFARVDFYERTKLYRTIVAKGGSVYQGAATIRYRRFIRPFKRFEIHSRITFWDEQSIFMEHRFINPADNFIHAIAVCRQRLVNCSAEEVMRELVTPKQTQLQATQQGNMTPTISVNSSTTTTQLEQVENGEVVPGKWKIDPPPEIVKWIEYNEISSKTLRKDCLEHTRL